MMMNSPGLCMCLINSLPDDSSGRSVHQLVRVDQNRLMAHVLWTLHESFRKTTFDVAFQFPAFLGTHAVPELGAAVMHVVNAGQVKIFHVGGEHCAETPDVQIGKINSPELCVS